MLTASSFWGNGAMFSGTNSVGMSLYRPALWRIDDYNTDPPVLFIMLNPSTADAAMDDPTIRRCRRFAKLWGYGDVYIANLFSYRATDPKILKAAGDPVGPDNKDAIQTLAQRVDGTGGLIVCAWGVHGAFLDQDQTVLGWLDEIGLTNKLRCFGTTKAGHPKHPLYLPRLTPYVVYRP